LLEIGLQRTKRSPYCHPNIFCLKLSYATRNIFLSFSLISLERTKWQLDSSPNVFPLIISLERIMWPPSPNPNIFPLVISLERTKWPRCVSPNIFPLIISLEKTMWPPVANPIFFFLKLTWKELGGHLVFVQIFIL
jgi:hypothetical protein